MSKTNNLITTKVKNNFQKQLNNLLNAKEDSFSVINTKNTVDIAIIAIRLYPSMGATNFKRNPFFNLEFQIFKDEFFNLLNAQEMEFKCHQHSNILYFVISCEKKDVSPILELTSLANELINEINSKPKELELPLLKHAISLDLGIVSFTDKNDLAKFWLYELFDRAQAIVSHANTEIYPNILVTNNFYQHLNVVQQNDFTKAYYIKHIACYGKQSNSLTKNT